ncbi:DUF6531 domain-containing protein [Candidatus Accumulibacter contiguus]|jgi:YD repeat-containing protein|uniref:DUF6531 domain-containing protein n=1 Tax=Candidatus Accumulibacter contiguus TaxID=2954381 RepID=UPI002FC2B641
MTRLSPEHQLTALRTVSALCATLFSSLAWSTACSYTNFSIGSEFVAKAGPVNGQYLYSFLSLRCGPDGQVIDGGIGGGGEIEVGWYEPANLESGLKKTFGAAFAESRVFASNCKLHLLLVNRRYPASQSIAGVSMADYPDTTGRTTYENVFPGPLLLPFGTNIPPPGSCGCSGGLVKLPGSPLCALPPEKKKPDLCIANPIVPGQGCKVQWETDYAFAGTSPLAFKRYYDSQSPYHVGSASRRSLGNRWRHHYDVLLNPAAATNLVLMLRDDGQILYFRPRPGSATQWIGDADIVGQLEKTATGWTYRDSDDAVETYDASGRRLTRTDRDGLSLRFSYAPGANTPSRVEDHFGRRLTFTHDSQGLLSELTDPAGHKVIYTYDAAGNLITVTYPDGTTRSYTYTSLPVAGQVEPALLTGLTDENGVPYAHWTYDSSALVASSEHAGGVDQHRLSYQKDGSGKITGATHTNPFNAVSEYRFQEILGAHKINSISHALLPGVTQRFTYDANGNLSTRTDFNGRLDTYTYDLPRNLETRRVEASGQAEARTVSTQWHPAWRRPVKVAEPKRLTTWILHGDSVGGNVVSCAPSTNPALSVVCQKSEQATADAAGSSGFAATPSGLPRTWTFTYNDRGRVLTADGPRTNVADLTTYGYYDAADPDPGKRGHLATVTNALGHLTQITAYDPHGNPLTVIDANGRITTLSYDSRQRLASRSIDGEVTTYSYDPAGQLTRVTLPDGSSLAYTWDPAHRLTAISDNLGNQIVYTLDAMGNRLREDIRDPANQLAQTRQRLYDGLGRLAQDIGARGQITAYRYDANGNRSQITDPLDQRSSFAYDALDRLLQFTDPTSGQTRYQYDGLDRLTSVTDPRNLATTYSVDGLGNRLRQQSPDSGLTTSTYDAAGNEITRTDAKGQTSVFTWDALNRPTRISYADGSRTDYFWDQGENGIGRLTRIDDTRNDALVSRLENRYDAQGRLLSQTRSVGGVSHTTAWTWSAGRMTGLTTPSGRTIAYSRDAIGRISEVRLTDSAPGGDGQTRVIATDIHYHPFGGIKSYRNGAGQVHTRNQDQDGRIASYTLGSQNWLLSYDAAGRISAQFDAANAAQSATYGYDGLDRLTSASLPSTAYGYTWDATGNRSSHTLGSSIRNYTIDPLSNRLQSVGSAPPKIYSHDANGSITSDGANTYVYDGKGRLTQTSTAAGVTRYDYNGLGERIRKQNATDTRYLYDPEGRLIAESAADGTIQREYLWLEDLPLAVMQ